MSIFDDLRANPYISTYVGSPIEELKTTAGVLQQRADKVTATGDQLARMFGELKAVKQDEPFRQRYEQELRTSLDEIAKEPEFGSADVMSLARDFALNPQLKAMTQTYKDYMADVAEAREKGYSGFQTMKMKEALDAYGSAGGAEDQARYIRVPFYEEQSLFDVGDKAVTGITEEIAKGKFDEDGNLVGAYYIDEQGNRIQLKKEDVTEARIKSVAASRLLQDPKTIRQIKDEYKYQYNKEGTQQELLEYINNVVLDPLVAKRSKYNREFSVSGKKGDGSGSGSKGFTAPFTISRVGDSYKALPIFDKSKFETYSKSGRYISDVQNLIEKNEFNSPVERYKAFSERGAQQRVVKIALDSTFEGNSLMRNFVDDLYNKGDILDVYYQYDSEAPKNREDVLNVFQNMAESPLVKETTTTDEWKDLYRQSLNTTVSKQSTALQPYSAEESSSMTVEEGLNFDYSKATSPKPVYLKVHSNYRDYMKNMLDLSTSPDDFIGKLIAGQETAPRPYNYGSNFNWEAFADEHLKGEGEERRTMIVKELKAALEKNMFYQNVEDYITDENVGDVSVTPTFESIDTLFRGTSSSGTSTAKSFKDNTIPFVEQLLTPTNGNFRSGIALTPDKNGNLIDLGEWAEDNIENYDITSLDITGIGSINAPNSIEIKLNTNEGQFDKAVQSTTLPIFFTQEGARASNFNQKMVQQASGILSVEAAQATLSDQERESIMSIYSSFAFPTIVENLISQSQFNQTNQKEPLTIPGIEIFEKVFNVERIIPQFEDGFYSLVDEDNTKIIDQEYDNPSQLIFDFITAYSEIISNREK